jgi:hypothetical protein
MAHRIVWTQDGKLYTESLTRIEFRHLIQTLPLKREEQAAGATRSLGRNHYRLWMPVLDVCKAFQFMTLDTRREIAASPMNAATIYIARFAGYG